MKTFLKSKGDSTFLNFKLDSNFPINCENKFISFEECWENKDCLDFKIEDDSFLNREFRWSIDGREYSAWMNFSLSTLEKLQLQCRSGFHFDIRWTLLKDFPDFYAPTSFSLKLESTNSIQIALPLSLIKTSVVGGDRISGYSNNSSGIPSLNSGGVSFGDIIQKQNGLIDLQKKLSTLTNQMYGYDCLYIKLDPEMESKDPLLKEWGILEHRCPIQFKVLVPSGEFPEASLSMDVFGIQFEAPFEIHIDKDYFQSFFGDGSSPQKYDLIYFKIIDRMFEIQSSILDRKFLNSPSYFKVNLVKAEKRNNSIVAPSEQIQDQIDELMNHTLDFDSVYDELEKERESLKITDPLVSTPKNKDRSFGRILKIDDRIIIKREDIYNNNILVTKAFYNFSHPDVVSKYKGEDAVVYRTEGILTNSHIFNFWFRIPPNSIFRNKIYSVEMTTKESPNEIKIKMPLIAPILKIGNFISVRKEGGILFGKIKEINKKEKWIMMEVSTKQFIDSFVEQFGEISLKLIEPKTIMESTDGKMNIVLWENDLLWFRIGEIERLVKMESILGKWNNLTISYLPKMGNSIDAKLYSPISGKVESLIENVFGDEIKCGDFDELESTLEYKIKVSEIDLANVRKFNTNINDEQLVEVINQYIVGDSQNLVINDVCQIQENSTLNLKIE